MAWVALAGALAIGMALGWAIFSGGGSPSPSLVKRMTALEKRLATEVEQRNAHATSLARSFVHTEESLSRRMDDLAAAIANLSPAGDMVREPDKTHDRPNLSQLHAAVTALADRVTAVEAAITAADSRQADLAKRLDRTGAERGTTSRQPATATPAPTAVNGGTAALAQRFADLEKSNTTALETLDQAIQALSQRADGLKGRDDALAKDLEATRIALDAELADWRDRQTPPLNRLATRLEGRSIRFSEGDRFADPAAADALMREAAGWLMTADPTIGLRIVGYADIDGSGEPSNRITSQKRADAVREAMLRLGIDADRLVAVGRSTEDRLVNDDSGGNANRRVAFEPFYREGSP